MFPEQRVLDPTLSQPLAAMRLYTAQLAVPTTDRSDAEAMHLTKVPDRIKSYWFIVNAENQLGLLMRDSSQSSLVVDVAACPLYSPGSTGACACATKEPPIRAVTNISYLQRFRL
ncbi:MAG: hypothetical protein MRY72_08860 [Aquisalinus sp.]|nr:hypothetical protein [Aquisalinus sp.]